jgi:hypothetical protein
VANQGWDCLTVADQGFAGHPDSDIAEVCQTEGRILVTLDVGFADIRSYPPKGYSGFNTALRSTSVADGAVDLERR